LGLTVSRKQPPDAPPTPTLRAAWTPTFGHCVLEVHAPRAAHANGEGRGGKTLD